MIHSNSAQAHQENQAEAVYSKREQAILDFLKQRASDCGRVSCMTDRTITELMGFTDMNSCRPRITELLAKGALIEEGIIKCRKTGKTVRLVALGHQHRQIELRFTA